MKEYPDEGTDAHRKQIIEKKILEVHGAIIAAAYCAVSYILPFMLYRWIMGPSSTEGWHIILIGFVGTPILMWLSKTSPVK
jgi:hypothetical protein